MLLGGRVALEVHRLHDLRRLTEEDAESLVETRRREDLVLRYLAELRIQHGIDALDVQDRVHDPAPIVEDMFLRLGGGLPIDEGLARLDLALPEIADPLARGGAHRLTNNHVAVFLVIRGNRLAVFDLELRRRILRVILRNDGLQSRWSVELEHGRSL